MLILVREFEKSKIKDFIPKKRILSKKEVNELENFLKELRKEYGFRL